MLAVIRQPRNLQMHWENLASIDWIAIAAKNFQIKMSCPAKLLRLLSIFGLFYASGYFNINKALLLSDDFSV